MTVTATATLQTSGSLTAPKKGDVLDYRVVPAGDEISLTITPAAMTVTALGGQPQTVDVAGGPWTITIPDAETIPAPVVTGPVPLDVPFTQDPADPRHWSATI